MSNSKTSVKSAKQEVLNLETIFNELKQLEQAEAIAKAMEYADKPDMMVQLLSILQKHYATAVLSKRSINYRTSGGPRSYKWEFCLSYLLENKLQLVDFAELAKLDAKEGSQADIKTLKAKFNTSPTTSLQNKLYNKDKGFEVIDFFRDFEEGENKPKHEQQSVVAEFINALKTDFVSGRLDHHFTDVAEAAKVREDEAKQSIENGEIKPDSNGKFESPKKDKPVSASTYVKHIGEMERERHLEVLIDFYNSDPINLLTPMQEKFADGEQPKFRSVDSEGKETIVFLPNSNKLMLTGGFEVLELFFSIRKDS